ncbi:MAG: hypothetical protein ABIJ91_02195 [Candidatus Kuenenbacteria bacterium]
MDKIKKLLRKISTADRVRLKVILKLLLGGQFDLFKIEKIKGTHFYKVRKGRFRVIIEFNDNKDVIIHSVRLRNENTYKF